jgi:hypothetical protein
VRTSSGGVLPTTFGELSALAAELYALPATVVAVAALMFGFWAKTIRY